MGNDPHENLHENEMIAGITKVLKEELGNLDEEFHLLYHFSIPGYSTDGKKYESHLDMAVLKDRQLTILELKSYKGRIEVDRPLQKNGKQGKVDLLKCDWKCTPPQGAPVVLDGGKPGRNPFRQVFEYWEQMKKLMGLSDSILRFREKGFKIPHFVSGFLVFPDLDTPNGDSDLNLIRKDISSWKNKDSFNVVRIHGLAEAIMMRAAGRETLLDRRGIVDFLQKDLALKEGHLVGNIPALGGTTPSPSENTPPPEPVTKIVQVPVEKTVYLEKTVPIRGEYSELQGIYESKDSAVAKTHLLAALEKRMLDREIKNRFQGEKPPSPIAAIARLFPKDGALQGHIIRITLVNKAIEESNDHEFITEEDARESLKTVYETALALYGEPVPDGLPELCAPIVYRPTIDIEKRAMTRYNEFFRLQVTEIDPSRFLLTGVDPDDPKGKEYSFFYSDGSEDDVYRDLDAIVSAGDVVGIVSPHSVLDKDIPMAGEIVLEPDYLISPEKLGQASASGKENRNPEFLYWLRKLYGELPDDVSISSFSENAAPQDKLYFRLRGDFANLSLAEHSAGGDADTNHLLKGFFGQKNLDLTALNPKRDWAMECKTADRNISDLLANKLQKEPYSISPDSWQLEAPFYSPVYGISARMDAVSYQGRDHMATVFELKSGKWDDYRNAPQLQHLCQPIFYSDLLHFTLGIQANLVRSLLYYSSDQKPRTAKRGQGPDQAQTAPEGIMHGRLFRVQKGRKDASKYVDLRNRVLGLQNKIRDGGFRPLVKNLKEEDFCQGETEGYWTKYKRPEFTKLLAPYHQASPLVLDYFYRQLKFLADEEFAGRLGSNEQSPDAHFHASSLWRLPLSERKEKGIGLSKLLLSDKQVDELHRVTSLTFETNHDPSNEICSIRQGDKVCLYRRTASSPDITKARVFSATVANLGPALIELVLEMPQQEALFEFSDKADFAIDPTPAGDMYSEYQGLWYFLTGNPRRKQLVLNEVAPEVDTTARLPIADSDKRYPDGLSEILLHAWQAKDWYLIWGPPGTGKTSHAMRGLVDQAMAVPGMRILLLAYTYKATDNICQMLEERLPLHKEDQYLRLGNPLKCAEELRGRMIDNLGLKTRTDVKALLDKTRIVVSVVSSLSPFHPLFYLQDHFDMAIVDEASQLLDVHVLPLFCAHRSVENPRPLIDKFVFIGDDKQLSAVVQQDKATSEIHEESLRGQGFRNCRESFFARLHRTIGGEDPARCSILSQQYRMHPTISDFPRRFFYHDLLQDGNASHQLADLPPAEDISDPFQEFVLSRRIGFIPVFEPDHTNPKTSEAEADACVKIIETLTGHPACPETDDGTRARPYRPGEIGVIVPFRNQIARLKHKLADKFDEASLDEILIDTVERFQGSERPVIIFSTVISYSEQGEMIGATRNDDGEDDEEDAQEVDQKLNVAITRARDRFYLVGQETALRGLRAYREFLQFMIIHDDSFEDEMPF